MARCDRGYLCSVCNEPVDTMPESELYLRFVLGEIQPDWLQAMPDRHLRCNPELGQFIEHPDFPPMADEEPLTDKRRMDPAAARARTEQVTRGYFRLLEIPGLGVPLMEMPLPEVVASWPKKE